MPYRKAADMKITHRVEFNQEELKQLICTELEQHDEYSNTGVDPDEMDISLSFDPNGPDGRGDVRAVVTWKTEKDLA